MSDSPSVEAAWRSHRPYLVNLAYQMLGDVGEAEDVAQEAFLRLSRADRQQIDDVRAWLTVVGGPAVPGPAAVGARPPRTPRRIGGSRCHAVAGVDPADRVTLDDEVRTALLEVLRRLSPGERVAFVLHDVFQMPFDEIAETVGRPVGTCRQLARRARAKFADASAITAAGRGLSDAEHQLVTEKFITACANGDLQALTAVLDPTVWGVGTIARRPRPAAADQPRPGRGGYEPAALPGPRRHAGQRTGRGAGAACIRRPAAVRGARADGARQPDSQDRGDGRPVGRESLRSNSAWLRVHQHGLLAVQLREQLLETVELRHVVDGDVGRGRVRVQVILVVVLGREEARVPVGARDDRRVEDLRLVELRDVGVGDLFLNVVLREDRRSILVTDVGALPVQLGRVVDDGEEDVKQLSEVT